jgi:hypothetical protein
VQSGGDVRGNRQGPERITRRAVLQGAAAAGAASLVVPTSGLAAGAAASALPASERPFSRWVGALNGESGALAAPRPFSLVGVQWSGPAEARIELRTRGLDGTWGNWAVASVLGHGPDSPPDRPGLYGEAIWTGPAADVQLRSTGPVQGVRLHFIGVTAVPEAGAAQAFPLAQPVLDAGPGQPPIIARSAWAHGRAPFVGPYYGQVKLAFVHHSVTPNGYSAGEVPGILLGIYQYHRYVRGFFDIAYNFAIDAFGRMWEARAGGVDLQVIGAHAGGYNNESTGVVVLGTFMDVVPSAAAIGALEPLLAWKLSLHGLPTLGRVTVVVDPSGAIYTPFRPGQHVSLPRVAGHRDGCTTDCPGDAFYARLPSIRPHVASLAAGGAPARLTLGAPQANVTAGTTVALSGQLAALSGPAMAGAPVEVQQVGLGIRQTIASLVTADDGSWSYSFAPSATVLLRALHRPSPASSSDLLLVEVAPAITLSLVSSAPLQVSGTVSPAKAHVFVDLYRVKGGHRHLVKSKRVAAGTGSFETAFVTPKAGRYVLVARTVADLSNLAGASAPIPVTIP